MHAKDGIQSGSEKPRFLRPKRFSGGTTLQHKGSLYFTRPTLANYCAARGDFEASVARVFDMVASGAVRIEIAQRYSLDDAVQAHSDLEGGRTSGSSILIP